jgi:hypothetical protein
MVTDIQEINKKIEKESAFVDAILLEMGKVIVGQKEMVERLLVGLLANGHILLEGVPGLAKTLAVRSRPGKGRSLPTLSWPMRSTGPPQRYRVPSWSLCRNVR